jgi:DNA-binding CsgD family transcriptional regulator
MGDPSATAVLERLTPREHDVLARIIEGRQSKEIAADLDLSPKRVDKIVESIRTKLDAPTRVVAARRYQALVQEGGVILPERPSPRENNNIGMPAEGRVPPDAVFTFSDSATFSPGLPWAEPRATGAPKPWTRSDMASRLVMMLVGTVALAVAILLVAGLMLGASLIR